MNRRLNRNNVPCYEVWCIDIPDMWMMEAFVINEAKIEPILKDKRILATSSLMPAEPAHCLYFETKDDATDAQMALNAIMEGIRPPKRYLYPVSLWEKHVEGGNGA